MSVQYLPVTRIRMAENTRPLDVEHAHQVAESMERSGQNNPILVRMMGEPPNESYLAFTGQHRLYAAKTILQWTTILGRVVGYDDIKAELSAIDDNLVILQPGPSWQVLLMTRRQNIYEALHPETRAGVAGARARHKRKTADDKKSFAQDAAEKTGKHERSVQRVLAIGKTLSAERLREVAGTSLDAWGKLEALGKVPEDQQHELVRKAVAGEQVTVCDTKPEKNRASADASTPPEPHAPVDAPAPPESRVPVDAPTPPEPRAPVDAPTPPEPHAPVDAPASPEPRAPADAPPSPEPREHAVQSGDDNCEMTQNSGGQGGARDADDSAAREVSTGAEKGGSLPGERRTDQHDPNVLFVPTDEVALGGGSNAAPRPNGGPEDEAGVGHTGSSETLDVTGEAEHAVFKPSAELPKRSKASCIRTLESELKTVNEADRHLYEKCLSAVLENRFDEKIVETCLDDAGKYIAQRTIRMMRKSSAEHQETEII